MKLLGTQFALMFREVGSRRNFRVLGKLLLFMLAMICVWALLFQVIMVQVEGQQHSWFTGFYWALTVMTTLGFGDITFHSDLGRLFSSVVLLSGVVYLLVVMPFAFIRFFYAPWLEAQDRLRIPRKLDPGIRAHVILAGHDEVAIHTIAELKNLDVPYVLLEKDPQRAMDMKAEGLSVVTGEFDNRETFLNLRAAESRMLVANLDDASNSNLILTFRELAPRVPVVALVEDWDAIDVIELSGANQVIPIKHRLGQQLASWVPVGRASTVVVGRFHRLVLAELAVHHTPFFGKTIGKTRIRESFGLNVVGVWEGGRFAPARPETQLTPKSVIGLLGTQAQLDAFDRSLQSQEQQEGATLVLGGGKVGRAACRTLRKIGVRVHMVERDPNVAKRLEDLADEVHVGDAADRQVLINAGLDQAAAVVLTTNDDATNIYLTIYCRRLNPQLRIVSRITHNRNVDSIYRAGADFVLSSSVLAVQSLTAALLGRELIMLGFGTEVFEIDLPGCLKDKSLAESRIGEQTGLNVIALRSQAGDVKASHSGLRLQAGSKLIMIGTTEQLGVFKACYGEVAC